MTVSPTSCRRNYPWFSPIARRRELLRPCSRTYAPCSRDRLRTAASCNGAVFTSLPAIHGLMRSKIQQFASPVRARTMRATGAPRTRRADDGNARRVAHRTCASSPQAHGWAVGEPRRPRANPQRRDARRACSRGGLLFGNFLLATQEKVTRAPRRRAEKDMDVEVRLANATRRCGKREKQNTDVSVIARACETPFRAAVPRHGSAGTA